MRLYNRVQCLGLALVVLTFLPACTAVPKKSGIMQSVQADVRVSAVELRVRVRGLADDFSLLIEMAADAIREESTDPEVRRNALLWKLNSIPLFQAAAFSPDPAGALADSWALAKQMRAFLGGPSGDALFGEWQPEAIRTAEQAEIICEELVGDVISDADFERAELRITQWAEANPIQNLTFQRKSLYTDLKTGAVREGVDSLTALESVATMVEQVEDIEQYLTVFNKHFPARIRWQVDLLVEEVLREADTDSAVQSLSQIGSAASELTPLLQEAPRMISSEREAVFRSVAEEREATLEQIDALVQKRESFLAALEQEIAAGISEQRSEFGQYLTGERVAILKAIDVQVAQLTDDIRLERKTLLDELDLTSSRLIGEGFAKAERLVDRFFLWLALCLAGFLLLGFGSGLLLVRYAKQG